MISYSGITRMDSSEFWHLLGMWLDSKITWIAKILFLCSRLVFFCMVMINFVPLWFTPMLVSVHQALTFSHLDVFWFCYCYIYISLFWAQEGFPVSATPCMVWFLYVHVTSSFMSFMQDFYFSLYYSNDHDHAHSFSLVFEKLQWSVACEPTFILWIIIQLLSDPFFYVKNKNKVLLLSFER